MSLKSDSPFSARFRQKVKAGMEGWKFSQLTRDDFRLLQRAFVEALKEEVEVRFHVGEPPLRIAGLGSFKMRTRPQRTFYGGVANEINTGTAKPPARRLVFTAKWEEIK